MKMKLFLIVVAILAVSSLEWIIKKISGLVFSRFQDAEEA